MLNLRDAEAVRQAFTAIQKSVAEKAGAEHFQGVTVQPMAKLDGYELILGASLDAQFGPVLLFGTGGQLVEVFKDSSLALPPLNSTLARRMMEQTKIYHGAQRRAWTQAGGYGGSRRPPGALQPTRRGTSVDQGDRHQPAAGLARPPAGAGCPRRFHGLQSPMTRCRSRRFGHIPSSMSPRGRPRGVEVTIRPIRPEDEPKLIEFHKALSEQTVLQRYFQPLKFSQRTAHERLTRICFIDYDREMALVVEQKNAIGETEIVAVGRMGKTHGMPEGELAVLVSDTSQGQGLGKELYRRLVQIARDEKLTRLHSNMLSDNVQGKALCQALGFKLTDDGRADNLLIAVLVL